MATNFTLYVAGLVLICAASCECSVQYVNVSKYEALVETVSNLQAEIERMKRVERTRRLPAGNKTHLFIRENEGSSKDGISDYSSMFYNDKRIK